MTDIQAISTNQRALAARYLRPLWPQVTLLAVLLIISTALQVWSPQVIRDFIDAAVGGSSFAVLQRLAALYTALAVGQRLFSAWGQYLGDDVGWRATNSLRSDLIGHCLSLGPSFHKAHSPGELVERIDGDSASLAELFSRLVAGLAANALFLAMALGVLFRTNLLAGATVALSSGFALFVLLRMRKAASPLWAKVMESMARFYGCLGEWIEGMEDLKACGASGWVLRRLHENARLWYPWHRRAMMARFRAGAAGLFLFGAGTVAALAVAAALFLKGRITFGTAFAIFTYAEMVRRPLEQLELNLRGMQSAGGSLSRVSELLASKPAVSDSSACESSPALPQGAESVEFANVTFSYEGDAGVVLDNISFRLEPGRVLGVLGRTGAGKTTIARLLFRFYDPDSGEVRLGGKDIRSLRLADLRRRVALVTQDVQILQASLRDNLTFFDRSIPDQRLCSALNEVGLGQWLAALPEGLDTVIGPGGRDLSAGEAQLVAFARLSLRDPAVIILDEASSRLDPATESSLEAAVSASLKGRTGVIIAHRLATLERTDDILILEGGRIVEHGRRVDLVADPSSRYSRLLHTGIEEVLR
ncbi:MAG: ABC transporter ATP-binding protein [Bacillota bacterium]